MIEQYHQLHRNYLTVNYKSLVGIVPIDNRSTCCFFRDSFTGKVFKRILAVSQKQIELWFNGLPIRQAIPHVSREVQELFKTGLTDKDFSKLLEES